MGIVEDSAHDKLDNMLHEGTISEDDYRNLSKALAASPEPPRVTEAAKPSVGLRKSWNERQLGGVCAGLARHFGITPVIVRVATVIVCLFACPAVVLVYLGMYFLLPWDDAEAAKDKRPLKDALRLALWGVTFLTLVPTAFALLLWPALMSIYRDFGAPAPLATRYAFRIADIYRNGLTQGLVPWGVLISLTVAGFATLFCCVIHHDMRRRAYLVAFCVLALGWTLFFCVGGCSGLLLLATNTK